MLVSFDGHYPGRRALFLVHVTCRRTPLSHVNGFPVLQVLLMCPTPSMPSAFLVCSCPAYRCSTSHRSISGLSCPRFDTLLTYHARLPRRTLRNLTVSYAETVPLVLSSAPLKTSSSSSTHFRGCIQLQESRLPVVCKVPCVHFSRFVLRVGTGQSGLLYFMYYASGSSIMVFNSSGSVFQRCG